jgi:hypothetical protein
MQEALTATIAIAALFFSLMCALLLEEFIFGGLFHLLRPAAKRAAASRDNHLFGNSGELN